MHRRVRLNLSVTGFHNLNLFDHNYHHNNLIVNGLAYLVQYIIDIRTLRKTFVNKQTESVPCPAGTWNQQSEASRIKLIMFPYLILALLNPFIFSPLSLFVKWLPALYLAAWPVIIQTLGREALITHALVVILFIITCDIARQTTMKLVSL